MLRARVCACVPVCVCVLRKYTVIVLDVLLVNTLYVHGIKGGKLLIKCCNKFNGVETTGVL